ncbi:MAG: 2TM domain-containing protein [Chlorobia bacterium]|nr:2TM domain-containing protein [Fimbriimonadaceae bacterium]
MNEHSHYNDQDAEEILRIASRDTATGGMSRDKLVETAAELGITPEAVAKAEEQLVMKREADRGHLEDQELRKQFEGERRGSFMTDLWSYLGTNAGLVGIWYMTGANYFWPGWVLFGWGIAVVTDGLQTFFNKDETKFQRWKRRRHRKAMGSEQMGDQSVPVLDEITAAGEVSKIEAIKELRERLSLDLRDAKDMADKYEQKNPGVFT